jgi:hypothetical protein
VDEGMVYTNRRQTGGKPVGYVPAEFIPEEGVEVEGGRAVEMEAEDSGESNDEKGGQLAHTSGQYISDNQSGRNHTYEQNPQTREDIIDAPMDTPIAAATPAMQQHTGRPSQNADDTHHREVNMRDDSEDCTLSLDD